MKSGRAKASEEDAVNPVKPISDNKNSKENHSEQEEEHVDDSSTEILFKCNQCDLIFKNNKGLKIHVGKAHKVVVQQTPEKERSNSLPKELSLSLTPIKNKRDEEEVVETPEQVKVSDLDQNSSFMCEYCKYPPQEFKSEAQLSIHHSKRHSYRQDNVGRIHQCQLCLSNTSLSEPIRNNYYTEKDLKTHSKTIHECNDSIIIKWDGFFET